MKEEVMTILDLCSSKTRIGKSIIIVTPPFLKSPVLKCLLSTQKQRAGVFCFFGGGGGGDGEVQIPLAKCGLNSLRAWSRERRSLSMCSQAVTNIRPPRVRDLTFHNSILC